jgi:hypothetical protein
MKMLLDVNHVSYRGGRDRAGIDRRDGGGGNTHLQLVVVLGIDLQVGVSFPRIVSVLGRRKPYRYSFVEESSGRETMNSPITKYRRRRPGDLDSRKATKAISLSRESELAWELAREE